MGFKGQPKGTPKPFWRSPGHGDTETHPEVCPEFASRSMFPASHKRNSAATKVMLAPSRWQYESETLGRPPTGQLDAPCKLPFTTSPNGTQLARIAEAWPARRALRGVSARSGRKASACAAFGSRSFWAGCWVSHAPSTKANHLVTPDRGVRTCPLQSQGFKSKSPSGKLMEPSLPGTNTVVYEWIGARKKKKKQHTSCFTAMGIPASDSSPRTQGVRPGKPLVKTAASQVERLNKDRMTQGEKTRNKKQC